MASKIFLDANVLINLTLKRAGYTEAKALFDLIIAGRVQAFTTAAIIHITAYYTRQVHGSKKAKDLLLGLLMDVKVIDINHEMAMVALSSQFTDIEDSLQYFAAVHHKLDLFISADKQLKKDSLPILPVITVKECLNAFE